MSNTYKIGDRVEVFAPDPNDGWTYIRGPGPGAITGVSGDYVEVRMDDPALMAPAPLGEGWLIKTTCVRPLAETPAPDPRTTAALELAEAVLAHYGTDPEDNSSYPDEYRRVVAALRAYARTRPPPSPADRLRALIEAHGGEDKAALLAVLEDKT